MEKQINIFEILMDAICCVMCADKKVTTKERKAVHKILEKTKAPWDSDEINDRINRFIKRGKKEGFSDSWRGVLTSNAVPIRNRNFPIPKRLADLIDAALVDQPAIRFKTAAEFKKLLEGAL